MSTIFTLRLLDQKRYTRLSSVFQELKDGTVGPAAKEALAASLAYVQSKEFQAYNRAFSLVTTWPAHLTTAIQSAAVKQADALIEILVATLCLPKFQQYYTPDTEMLSENCFLLGEWDQGLLIFLQQNSDFWAHLFGADFPFEYAAYPYGESMALLTETQLKTCHETLLALQGVLPEQMRLAFDRLLNLLQQSQADRGYTLALSLS